MQEIRHFKKPENNILKHRFDKKINLSNNNLELNSSESVDEERLRDMEVRRAAIQLAASIAKKYSLPNCECCGKKLF